MARNANKIKLPVGDRVLDIITTTLLVLIGVIVAYPVIYVISGSFSSPFALLSGRVFLWPVEPNLDGYKFVLQYKQVWIGFRNSLFYTACVVLVNITVQVLTAYPLSKDKFNARKIYNKIIILTMLVNAGMIPIYLVVVWLGWIDTIWSIIFVSVISTSNIFILRTTFRSSIPGDLFDAAEIDGATDFQCLYMIALPLAKATLSVLCLWAMVGAWNEYFRSMLYLRDQNKYPLQLFLRTILTAAETIEVDPSMPPEMQEQIRLMFEQVKYCLIIVATVPVLIAYGFVQKYFKGGVMIGSLKG